MKETTPNQGTQSQSSFQDDLTNASNQVADTVKSLVAKGNVRSVVVRRNGRTIVELPLTVAVFATLLAPQLMLLGVVVAMLAQCSIEIEHHGGPNPSA